jgi:vancomycin permeability regulator SanA
MHAMTWIRWGVGTAAAAALAGVLAVAGTQAWLRWSTRDRRYGRAEDVPAAPVAIVLGAKVLPDGRPSQLLARRLDRALELYKAGTVAAILVSGDHGRRGYDEVAAMSDYLRTHGVPAGKIAADHAGFDTWASAIRARRVFGVRTAVMVTQHFHLPRAVALARRAGIEAYGLGDDSARTHPKVTRAGRARELLAGLKAGWTLLARPDPTYLGPYETAVDDAISS